MSFFSAGWWKWQMETQLKQKERKNSLATIYEQNTTASKTFLFSNKAFCAIVAKQVKEKRFFCNFVIFSLPSFFF